MIFILKVNKIYLGDNLELLKQLDDNSIHSCVSDFPYNLGFMGRKWDTISNYQDWCYQRAKEILRVLKPGGYCLIFGGTRTHHRLVCAFEDTGFEIKDEMQWIYSSGFPKSYNISKGFDKQNGRCLEERYKMARYIKEQRENKGITLKQLNEMFGYVAGCTWWESTIPNTNRVPNKQDWIKLKELLNLNNEFDWIIDRFEAEREVIGKRNNGIGKDSGSNIYQLNNGESKLTKEIDITLPETTLAKQWDGWGTALKPAQEPIMVAQKPIEKNYCYNVEKYGVGGININDCRVPFAENDDKRIGKGYKHNAKAGLEIGEHKDNANGGTQQLHNDNGRFPANIIFDEEAGKLLDGQSGITKSGKVKENKESYNGNSNTGFLRGKTTTENQYGDEGGASRFFYCAKASKKDRNENGLIENTHPTVKPTELIKYLVKLVTPKDGICLDICEGSGTHVKAILQLNKEGFNYNYIGFENDEESYKIACEREKINKVS